ncbi:TetR/AcrR family transcriptional regulator [Nonlabens tegetincola]
MRILRTAERMFAQHGFESVGMREIAAQAEVSVALLTYHFETKDNLYREIFRDRSEVLDRRLSLLESVVFDRPDTIAQIVAAFIDPQMELRATPEGLAFAQLLAREATDPSSNARGIIAEFYDPLAFEFIAALQRARPDLSADTVRWNYLFGVSALSMLSVDDRALRLGVNPELTVDETGTILKEFLVAGLTA